MTSFPKKCTDNHLSNRKKSGQKQVFIEIWDSRPHVCEICGRYISEPRAHNFDHILSKGLHPDKKFDHSNIKIVCFGCHFGKTTGLSYNGIDYDI